MFKRVLVVAFAAMLSLAALAGCSSNESKSQNESQDSQPTSQEATPSEEANEQAEKEAADSNVADALNVTMTVADADGSVLVEAPVQVAPESTVFDVLEASNVDFVSTEGDYGPYITSLNGIEIDQNSGWIFTLNGEEVMVGCDQQQVADGDVVAWQFMTF